jgi:malate dehydrogenase (quinone)
MIENRATSEPDVILVGAGIMSATLGVFLKELEPGLNILMVETLDGAALESSDAWNNAGTGHAANCELNYTPERSDGSIDISKALDVNVEFDLSRQLWSYLVRKGAIADPQSFIHPVPHMSFVHGPENVAFLKKRFAAMSAHHCWYGMEYGGPRRRRTGGRHADHHRRRRRLWIAHSHPRSLSRGHAGVCSSLLASRHPYQARAGRALAHRHEE